MLSPSARLLRLLALLQSRPRWGGPELTQRLQVSARTLRYDVEKLRGLGYPVRGEPGSAGGYEMRAGQVLPPLLLDDGEAVAMAIGLRLATGAGGDLEDSAATALAKLEQLLPPRLRGRVAALRQHTASAERGQGRSVDAELVLLLSAACRDRRRVRFDYTARGADARRRDVEPHRVLQLGGRWYLSAYDPEAGDWRSFRLDRMAAAAAGGARYRPRPGAGPPALVDSIDAALHRHRAVVDVAAPAEDVAARVPASVPVEVLDGGRCRVVATGESPAQVAVNLLMLDRDFTVQEASAQVREALREVSARAAAALGGQDPPRTRRGGAGALTSPLVGVESDSAGDPAPLGTGPHAPRSGPRPSGRGSIDG